MWSLLGDDGDVGGSAVQVKCGGTFRPGDPAFAPFGLIQLD